MTHKSSILVAALTVFTPLSARAQGTASPYPTMAPVEQYRMDRITEIALAKSAGPASVSDDADVLVLGPAGYETAVKGKNGFVCVVERAWANDFGKPEFWNPKVRSPFCYNAAGARSVLPIYLNRTKWALAGVSEAKMEERSEKEPAASGIRTPEVGAMVYMLSKDGYLGDDVKGPWHPHVMFLLPHTPAAAWGANFANSPVSVNDAPTAPVTVFVVQVGHWGDGTPDAAP
jgi:hypothetical protein